MYGLFSAQTCSSQLEEEVKTFLAVLAVLLVSVGVRADVLNSYRVPFSITTSVPMECGEHLEGGHLSMRNGQDRVGLEPLCISSGGALSIAIFMVNDWDHGADPSGERFTQVAVDKIFTYDASQAWPYTIQSIIPRVVSLGSMERVVVRDIFLLINDQERHSAVATINLSTGGQLEIIFNRPGSASSIESDVISFLSGMYLGQGQVSRQ